MPLIERQGITLVGVSISNLDDDLGQPGRVERLVLLDRGGRVSRFNAKFGAFTRK